MAKVPVGSAVALAWLTAAIPGFSQSQPPPAGPSPQQYPPAGASPAAPPPVAAPQPVAASQPAPNTTGYAYPPPAAASPAPVANGPAPVANTQPPGADYSNNGPPPMREPAAPPQTDETPFEFPDVSVRVDPLKWIIYGRLGLELEAAVWKFISVEVVPVFVTTEQPPFMNLGSFPSSMYQSSNGIGAMSGASLGAGFWLDGKPFRGTVFRLFYTNYGYRYHSKSEQGVEIDSAVHTERRIYGMLGSHSKWGPFTIATGLGLGMELNRPRRCIDASRIPAASSDCAKEVFEVQLQKGSNTVYEVYEWLHPAYLDFRLSLGLVF